MNQTDYVRLSLELHLFFARIMKEHSLFIEVAFLPKDHELRLVARRFQKTFAGILEKAICLADGKMSENFLESGEVVTTNTVSAENKTGNLSGVRPDINITRKELNLKAGNLVATEDMLRSVSELNREALLNIRKLVEFKQAILDEVLACKLYTANYPLLITHIMNEAKMYFNLLSKIESKEPLTADYLYKQEVFWNQIMKEHAEFIRGLLDPSETELIKTANQFAEDYNSIMKNYGNSAESLTSISLKETIDFQKFKVAGEEGILNCKIKSIIIPLLADHVLREANHFIRILNSVH